MTEEFDTFELDEEDLNFVAGGDDAGILIDPNG